jgi:hypothetical protein
MFKLYLVGMEKPAVTAAVGDDDARLSLANRRAVARHRGDGLVQGLPRQLAFVVLGRERPDPSGVQRQGRGRDRQFFASRGIWPNGTKNDIRKKSLANGLLLSFAYLIKSC